MANYVRERLGDAYINNAGQIRWIDGEEGANLPEWYYEQAFNDDDYNFNCVYDMVNTMDLCCWKTGIPDDQTGLVPIQIGMYEFFLNLRTNQIISQDKEYIVGEKNNTTPIYERQFRAHIWIPDDWECRF